MQLSCIKESVLAVEKGLYLEVIGLHDVQVMVNLLRNWRHVKILR